MNKMNATQTISPLALSFEAWLVAKFEANPYREAYIERAEDLQSAQYASVSCGGTTRQDAYRAYIAALLDAPRDAQLSLEVLDTLPPHIQSEAMRHFFDLDARWSEREQQRILGAHAQEVAALRLHESLGATA